MKTTAVVATLSYALLIISVLIGTAARDLLGEGLWADALGLFCFVLLVVFLAASGVALPILFTKHVCQKSAAPPASQSVFTWVLALSLLAMNIPATFLRGDTKAPFGLACALNITLGLMASFLFAVFSILFILAALNLLK